MAFDPFTAAMDLAGKALDKFFPNPADAAKAKFDMLQLQQQGQFKQLEIDANNALGQLEVNKAEAASGSKWASGWRPLIGYVGGVGYAFNYVILPLGVNVMHYIHPEIIPPKALDFSEMSSLMFAMLGLGGMRSFDKLKGTS